VVDIFECAVCEVGAEEVVEVTDAGALEGCNRASVRGATYGCVMEGGMGVDGGFAAVEHVKV
jgi:hypothetical protein